jgi:DNA-binding response OmpR family regulator
MACVLVIDDDPTIRQVVALVLGDEGHEVIEASDGTNAFRQIALRAPDVILLDMKMPGMDGWEFSRLYRQRHGSPAPIIVFTAARDAARRSQDVGADGYLSKPFDIDVLVERIEAALEQRARSLGRHGDASR